MAFLSKHLFRAGVIFLLLAIGVPQAVQAAAPSAPSYRIQGTVYLDTAGDGSLTGDPAAANVRVHLFRDDGDGQPDAGDVWVGATTATTGTFLFFVPNGTYWLAVDSRSGDLSDGATWAEQTYGPPGAWCANPDGLFGSGTPDPYERPTAGPCFGGRRGAVSDAVPASPSALDESSGARFEHLARVQVADADVTGLDFGFSFNVVTNANDQDDDPSATRICQGCLRQFIQNANALSGANAMRFVPAVSPNAGSGGQRWWSIFTTLDDLSVTGAQTIIDGTAYAYDDGSTIRDTNPGHVTSSLTVGTGPDGRPGTGDEPTIDPFARPELEINGQNADRLRFEASATGSAVRHLAFYRSAVYVRADQVTVADNLIGMHADGSENLPTSAWYGVHIARADQVTVRHNYLKVDNSGIRYQGFGDDWLVEYNLVARPASGHSSTFDGLLVIGGGNRHTLRANLVRDMEGAAVEIGWFGGPVNQLRIEDNTFVNNGRYEGGSPSTEDVTIVLRRMQSGSTVTIRHNIIAQGGGSGIGVQSSATQVTISQNAIYDNAGLGIDHDPDDADPNTQGAGDGVTPNNGAYDAIGNRGLDYPILTQAVLDSGGTTLTLAGYVGTATATTFDGQTMTLEFFVADNDPANQDGEVEAGDGHTVPHGEGATYLAACTVSLGTHGAFTCTLTVPAGTVQAGDFLTATATDADGNTSEFGPNFPVHQPSPYAGQVVLNEVGYYQSGGTSAAENDEFVEIYNAGSAAVDLQGWTLADGDPLAGTDDGLRHTFPASLVLQPGEYLVVWLGNAGNAPFADHELHLGLPSRLDDAGDDLQLYDAQNRLVDYMAYGAGSADPPPIPGVWDATYQSALAGAGSGQSLSLTPNGTDGNASACWEPTTSGDAASRCSGYRATIDADFADPTVHSAGVNNNGEADLTVTKDDGRTTYTPGSPVTYTVIVANHGPADLRGVTLQDPIPGVVTSWDWVCTTDPTGTCDGVTGSTGDFADTLDLAAGQSVTYTVTAQTDPAATADLVNTVTVALPSGYTDPNTGDNAATDTDAAAPQADLSLTKTAAPNPATPGDQVTYTLTVTNAGPSHATAVQVTDALPAGVTYQSDDCGGSASGGTWTWNVGSLSVGSTATCHLRVTVDPAATGSLDNTARVTAGTPDPDATNNQVTQTTALAPSADLSLSKTASRPSARPGDTVVFTIVLTNDGPSDAVGVQVTDLLPAGFAYVAHTVDQGTYDPLTGVWDVGTVAAGASLTLRLTATAQAGPHTNTAEVTDAGTPDPDSTPGDAAGDDYAQVTVPVVFDPPLGFKSVENDWPTLVWRMVWLNPDNATALGVFIVDPLPPGVAYITGSLTCTGQGATVVHTCVYNPAQNRIEVQADIAPDPGITDPDAAANALVIAFRTTVTGDVARVTNRGEGFWDQNGDGLVDDRDPNVADAQPVRTDPATAYRPELPATGFPPGRVTVLPPQPAAYAALPGLWLEIPRLGLQAPIWGVTLDDDLAWLQDVGWVQESAFPGQFGNSVLTAHNILATGTPGPFFGLDRLRWGDEVRVHLDGAVYIYAVREVTRVSPYDLRPLAPRDDGYAWLTLLTCANYDPQAEVYRQRLVVRAVLLQVVEAR